MKILYPEGATPLDLDETRGLIPRLTMQRELNEFEQTNIQSAVEWAKKVASSNETSLASKASGYFIGKCST